MKKISLLLLLFAFLLVGCNKANQTTTQNKTPIQNTSEPEIEEENTEVEGPDYVVHFYEEYKRVLEENNFGIEIVEKIEKSKSSSSISLYSYTVDLRKDGKNIGYLLFHTDLQGDLEKCGALSLTENATNDTIKNMITIILLVIDPSLSLSEAETIMQDMANSYNTGAEQPIHESDSYFTYLGISLFKDIPSIHFQHKDEMNVPVDTSLYSSFEYDAWMAPLNQGELACLTGEYISGSDYSKRNTIIGEDGQQYLVTYPPQWFFNILESNKRYTFYGDIRPSEHDLPVLDLSYCVPLD